MKTKNKQLEMFPGDITKNKHKGNKESVAAFEKIENTLPKQRMRVLFLFLCLQCTSKGVAETLNVGLNTISGRLSELKAAGYLKPTGERIDGAAVLRITEAGQQALIDNNKVLG
jgi:hypothetical protein